MACGQAADIGIFDEDVLRKDAAPGQSSHAQNLPMREAHGRGPDPVSFPEVRVDVVATVLIGQVLSLEWNSV